MNRTECIEYCVEQLKTIDPTSDYHKQIDTVYEACKAVCNTDDFTSIWKSAVKAHALEMGVAI